MSVTCTEGDALTVLRTFPDDQFHCCVTSPPYWGQRDYGVAGQIGWEQRPSEYVHRIVDVFREVRRVLRKDGTLWLNLGDSYYNYRYGHQKKHTFHKETRGDLVGESCPRRRTRQEGLKEKDLVGIPWSVAFALRADAWHLRSDVIWAKPNPMPESVADRPTKSHEYLFLLTKSERYYYDAEAIAEPIALSQIGRIRADMIGGASHVERGQHSAGSIYTGPRSCNGSDRDVRNKRSVWTVNTQAYPDAHFAVFPEDLIRPCILAGCPHGGTVLDPFAGSGTTLLVAKELGCSAVGIDLNPAYVALAQDRIAQEVLPFAPALDDTRDEEVMPLAPEPVQLTFDLEVA